MDKLKKILLRLILGLVILFVIATAGTLAWMWYRQTPTHNEAKLKALSDEARTLVARGPADETLRIPEKLWPPTIARLHPEWVRVFPWGVDVEMVSFFDGGWGYDIVTESKQLPMPIECYENLGRGIYWHGPC